MYRNLKPKIKITIINDTNIVFNNNNNNNDFMRMDHFYFRFGFK